VVALAVPFGQPLGSVNSMIVEIACSGNSLREWACALGKGFAIRKEVWEWSSRSCSSPAQDDLWHLEPRAALALPLVQEV
jgi:hypothetical protein